MNCNRIYRVESTFILLVVLLFASLSSEGQTNEAQNQPNIILIVADDQGYHDLGAYGSEEVYTPHLDQLASEGVRLTNFYVTSSICTPSRSGLLTGRYPQRNGTFELFRNDRVDDDHQYTDQEYSISPERVLGTDLREVFLSELLQQAGYTNGIFGKWDLGQLKRYLPLQQGFDDFYGFTNTGIDYYTHERYGTPSMFSGNEPTTADSGTYSTYLFEREALEFLDENKDRPFFLYLPFNAPHSASNLDPDIRGSVQAPEEYLKRYPEATNRQEARQRGYRAAVTCMDASIGKVLDRIKEYGLEENTIVVFLSDNGGGLGADNSPFRGKKGQFYEGGVRVPGIIKWPSTVAAGSVNSAFLSAMEIMPTLLAAANVSVPGSITLDGFDMVSVLQGESESSRQEMFWDLREDQAARVGEWKWLKNKEGESLFNLEEDVSEENDLSTDRPEVLKMMRKKFTDWQQTMAEAEPRGPFKDF